MTIFLTIRVGVDANDRADAEDEVRAVLDQKPGYITSYRIHKARRYNPKNIIHYRCLHPSCRLYRQSIVRLSRNDKTPRCPHCHHALKEVQR